MYSKNIVTPHKSRLMNLKCYPHPPSTWLNVMTSLVFPLCFSGQSVTRAVVPE